MDQGVFVFHISSEHDGILIHYVLVLSYYYLVGYKIKEQLLMLLELGAIASNGLYWQDCIQLKCNNNPNRMSNYEEHVGKYDFSSIFFMHFSPGMKATHAESIN